MRPSKRLLVANRGEIAVRIMDTAKKMGIETIAVYSDADRHALHVRMADDAVDIGPSPAQESYLNIERVIAAGRHAKADAIHPGYGFLSEHAAFARAVRNAGMIFVGPSGDAIEAIGNKASAKSLMGSAGVPMLPGFHGDAQDDATLLTAIEQVGRPALIKAVAGGGGRGMRLVGPNDDPLSCLKAARQEAASGFGDDRVLIEKFITHPRHVEVQVFADQHGHVCHLFERDCSLQRRHQKVLEEAPAPELDEDVRAAMGRAAEDAARSIGYEGAGTVEFLLDRDGSFYFLEINTRLQVEHPVTEMITGLDLVEWQLRIAAGEFLPEPPKTASGHAMEARLCAEVPAQSFRPSVGRITKLRFPDLPGLRVDSGVEEGDHVSPHYDSMLAKLITHGANRQEAADKLQLALARTEICGVETNRDFLMALLRDEEFRLGGMTTRMIDEKIDHLVQPQEISQEVLVLAIIRALKSAQTQHKSHMAHSPFGAILGWAMNGEAFRQIRLFDGAWLDYTIQELGQDCFISMPDGRHLVVSITRDDGSQLSVNINGNPTNGLAHLDDGGIRVVTQMGSWHVPVYDALAQSSGEAESDLMVRAQIPGLVTDIHVAEGDVVEADHPLLTMEAMKIVTTFRAQRRAKVGAVRAQIGGQVAEGQTLIILEDEHD